MQRFLLVAVVVATAECASLRNPRDSIIQFKQIEDFPPFDSADPHIWNHPWHKSFNAEHSSHGDIAIFGRFRPEGDSTLVGDAILTPVVPDVSHSNKQLGPDNNVDHLGQLSDRVVMSTVHMSQR